MPRSNRAGSSKSLQARRRSLPHRTNCRTPGAPAPAQEGSDFAQMAIDDDPNKISDDVS
jgi:hypothetical protein